MHGLPLDLVPIGPRALRFQGPCTGTNVAISIFEPRKVVAMNRALLLMVLALGMTVAGCASEVTDPVPPAPVAEEQRLPPAEPLSTELRERAAILRKAAEIDRGLDRVPLVLPTPGPWPETR